MKKRESQTRRVIRVNREDAWKCPWCEIKTRQRDRSFSHRTEFECPKCGIILAVLHYDTRKKRVDPHERILKPTARITKSKGGIQYLHYVIATTVPGEWKHGVRVRIDPIRMRKDSYTPIQWLRNGERDTYFHTTTSDEFGELLTPEKLEEYCERERAEGNHAEEIWRTHICIHCMKLMREIFEKEQKSTKEEEKTSPEEYFGP